MANRTAIARREIEQGMNWVARLDEVMPDQADAQIRAVYEDIKKIYRVPIVNFFFRVLAHYPAYLIGMWNRCAPALRTLDVERAADELRGAALLEPLPDASAAAWPRLGDLEKIRPFTDTIHYVLPKLLLTATAFHESFNSSGSATVKVSAASVEQIPAGIAGGTTTVPMVDPSQATGRLKRLFEEIQQRHGHPKVATYYRSLGHWPDFLEALWEKLAPLVGAASFEAKKQELLDQASSAVRDDFPAMQALRATLVASPEEAADISAICALFRFRLIPDLLIDVSLIKAMLDGRDAARRSPFSYTEKEMDK